MIIVKKYLLVIAIFMTIPCMSEIDYKQASAYIEEYNQICNSNKWQIWPSSLCSPILLVNPKTREVIASEKDSHNKLIQNGNIYLTTLPDTVPIANTSINWLGTHWAMLILPLPTNQQDRLSLMAHESLHQNNDKQGISFTETDNSHLNQIDGRFWLVLELRALVQAFKSPEIEKDRHLQNALIFREYRYRLYPNAKTSEMELERNEGLAEYTGIRVGNNIKNVFKKVEQIQNNSLERSFAYLTGPLYGLLLDDYNNDWKLNISNTFSFSEKLSSSINFTIGNVEKEEINKLAQQYHSQELLKKELSRQIETKQKIAKHKKHFVSSQHIEIPLHNMKMSFNPNSVFNLKNLGTVYFPLTVIDDWGKIVIKKGGGLINKNYTKLTVNAENYKRSDVPIGIIENDEWSLNLNPDWKIHSLGNNYYIQKETND